MTENPPKKKRRPRELTQASFDALLVALAADREQAAGMYEHLRHALQLYFSFRSFTDADELTDETITRVAARLHEGAANLRENPASYFYGVARNVWREFQARPMTIFSLEEDALQQYTVSDPQAEMLQAESEAETVQREQSLRECLQSLMADERELILSYYQGSGSEKIRHRQSLSGKLGVAPKTLRNKASLVRSKLADCVRQRLR
jgi:RNA polymerase sigma factor (sigma-70 family)